MSVVVRETSDEDVAGVVGLFCEDGTNPYQWSLEKWGHYYRQYPDGPPCSLVATVGTEVVGHYGLLPVRIGGLPAMLGLHAHVAKAHRGLTVLSALLRRVDEVCRERGVTVVCGFANPAFTRVKVALFKWQVAGWLGFGESVTAEDRRDAASRRYRFEYSDAWFVWRFGSRQREYLSRFVDRDGRVRRQVLKYSSDTPATALEGAEGWVPRATFSSEQAGRFCQPFSVRAIDRTMLEAGIADAREWSIDMGDSDTFQYTPWETAP